MSYEDDDTGNDSDAIDIFPVWKKAADAANKQFDYGQMISHEWLDNALEIRWPKDLPQDGDAEAFIKKIDKIKLEKLSLFGRFLNEMLVSHKKCLFSNHGKGYEVILPRDQTARSMESLRDELKREYRKAQDRLINIQTASLSQDQRRENAEATGRLAALAAFSKNSLRKRLTTRK